MIVGICDFHQMCWLSQWDLHVMQRPKLTGIHLLLLLGDESLAEHFLELCLIVELLNLHQLLLGLRVLVLQHLLWALIR